MSVETRTHSADTGLMSKDEIAKLVTPMRTRVEKNARFLVWSFLITALFGNAFVMWMMYRDPSSGRGEMIGIFVIVLLFMGVLPALVGRRFMLGDVEQVPHLLEVGSRFPGKLTRYARIAGGTMRHAVVEWDEDGIASGAHFDMDDPGDSQVSRDVIVIANLAQSNVAVVLGNRLYVGVRNSTLYRRWKTTQAAK